MKKPALIIGLLLFVAISLSVVKTFVSNNVATSGVVLSKVEEEIDKYKVKNALLSEKLYTLSSLTAISGKAKKMGYTKSRTDFVLNNQYPVAFKR
jgi:cell division protein FtsL